MDHSCLTQKSLDRLMPLGYPLTSAAFCSVCGERVAVRTYLSRGSRVLTYACRAHARRNHPLRRDGLRHGSCEVTMLETAVKEDMVPLLAGGEAEYDALDLMERRDLVRAHLRVLVHPVHTVPRFSIDVLS